MKRWWVSFRINENILNQFCYSGPWWVAGYANDDVHVCLAVCGETEDAVRSLVYTSFDRAPELTIRFIDERPADWEPFTRRFPRDKWMVWPLLPEQAMELRRSG